MVFALVGDSTITSRFVIIFGPFPRLRRMVRSSAEVPLPGMVSRFQPIFSIRGPIRGAGISLKPGHAVKETAQRAKKRISLLRAPVALESATPCPNCPRWRRPGGESRN